MRAWALRGFYAILDVKEDVAPDSAWLRARARDLLAAGPCCVQLRAKRLPARALRQAAAEVRALCVDAGVPFCVNDRVDVALAVGADVVHVGQDDLPLPEVLRLVDASSRPRPFIGVSTHSLAQAHAAARGGADYIGFGPVFATGSKHNPDAVVGLAQLERVVREVAVPVVAIGGIDLATVDLVAAAGAQAAAVIAAVASASDPIAAGRRVAAAFRAAGDVGSRPRIDSAGEAR